MARVIDPASSRFIKDRILAKPVLFTTQVVDGVPTKGLCSACDEKFVLSHRLSDSSGALRAMFEQHMREKHSETRESQQ
jgi:hypothetical protein